MAATIAVGLTGEDAAFAGLVGGETRLTLERTLCVEDIVAAPDRIEIAELTGEVWRSS